MFPIKSSKQSLILLITGAVLLLVVCGFVYYNLASKISALDVQIANKEERLENSQEIARRLSAVEQDYLDARAKLGALEQGVSTRAYVPTLLRQVEELGKSVNLRVVGVRPRPPEVKPPPPPEPGKEKMEAKKPEPPYDRLEIDVEMNGRYSDAMRFLYGITSFPKIIAVNTVQMTPVGEPETIASPELTVKLNATAFILKEPVGKPINNTKQTAQAVVGRT